MEPLQAIVVAAGHGKRFRSQATEPGYPLKAGRRGSPVGVANGDKPYVLLGSKPILAHTLEQISRIADVEHITVVVAPDRVDYCREEVVRRYAICKISRVIAGGDERPQSVWKGLEALEERSGWVLIHDGVRPFVPLSRIGTLVEKAKETGAAVLGVSVKPTLKEVDAGGRVARTLDRSRLCEVQTPQVFRLDILHRAYQLAGMESAKTATDDAALVEQMGHPVGVVEGDETNIKITTPFDLEVAEMILTNSKLEIRSTNKF
ncbi:MAG: 2-C-methyl-D-erythritol 4-phosphate cytidylyltransferase [Candidatus Omnitrophica bacterium]|nr:2-C-methyl-D-erythritol 4-phosphate cytidylyltransferase [Candidatus Omnitrophota bacterium]